ncbi:MAG: SDR family NAD(P)-dependent oxidoreductase [Methanobacteriota archaeon]
MRLRGKSALVTGGGRGIGRAVAERFAREGARVAVAARTAAELEETAKAIRAAGGEALAVRCDLRASGDIDRMAQEAVAAFRTIDVLVNNAGVFTEPFGVEGAPPENYDETMAVNVRAAWYTTKVVVPHMPADGSIINVTSGLARGPSAEYFPYSLSKAALEGLTVVEAAHLRQRANAVDPGLVATRMTDFSGRRPEDVTEVFVYLASDESRRVRGEVLRASKFPRRT